MTELSIRSAPALLALLVSALLSACSKEDSADESYPARVPLPQTASPLVIPVQPKGTVWSAGPDQVQFGLPGQSPLLRVACEQPGDPSSQIRVERLVAADPDAKAFFALIGPRHMARIPVDAQRSGAGSHWVGTFAAADPQLDILADGTPFTATVPGGGTLELSASSDLARLVRDCRSGAAPVPSAATTAQSLPNLPSNPAASPVAR